jgi:hypothetical protein
VRNCFELADKVGVASHIKIVLDKAATEKERLDAAYAAEQAVFQKVFELLETPVNKRKDFTPYVVAMGKRISQYRSRVKTAMKLNTGPSTAPLIELADLLELEQNKNKASGTAKKAACTRTTSLPLSHEGSHTLHNYPKKKRPVTKRLLPKS